LVQLQRDAWDSYLCLVVSSTSNFLGQGPFLDYIDIPSILEASPITDQFLAALRAKRSWINSPRCSSILAGSPIPRRPKCNSARPVMPRTSHAWSRRLENNLRWRPVKKIGEIPKNWSLSRKGNMGDWPEFRERHAWTSRNAGFLELVPCCIVRKK
jgi:hypothetical protein